MLCLRGKLSSMLEKKKEKQAYVRPRGSTSATGEDEETLKKMWGGVRLKSKVTMKMMRL